jgi:hypothetical protein
MIWGLVITSSAKRQLRRMSAMERATIDTHSRKYVKIHSAATFGSYAALQAPFAAEWAVGVSSLNSTRKRT